MKDWKYSCEFYFHSVKLVTVPATGKHRLSFYVQKWGENRDMQYRIFIVMYKDFKKYPPI